MRVINPLIQSQKKKLKVNFPINRLNKKASVKGAFFIYI